MTILYRVHHGLYVNLTNRCSCACTFCVRGLSDSVGEAESLWLSREPTYEEVIAAFGGFDMGQFNEVVFCGFGEPIYTQSWPTYDENKLVADEVEIAVQIKGKVRGRIMVPASLGKDDGEKLLENETVKKLVGDAQVKKIIFVPGRLLNIVY